jgi:ABC-type hemin transport system ATPase subunit
LEILAFLCLDKYTNAIDIEHGRFTMEKARDEGSKQYNDGLIVLYFTV